MALQFTYDIVDLCVRNFPEKEIFHSKKNGKWEGITSLEFSRLVDQLSYCLLAEGIRKGEIVASIFSYNTYEWNIIDLALSGIGAIHIPVYPTISDSDYLFILKQAAVRMVFLTDQVIYNKLTRLQKELPGLDRVITVENLSNVESLDQFLSLHSSDNEELKKKYRDIRQTIQPEDTCTILYTSGTTGFPKGVLLSHKNLCSNVESAAKLQPMGNGDRVLSFLPLCHVYERTAVYQFILSGAEVYYAESLNSVLQDMKAIQPHGITVVPRVLEKILLGLGARAKSAAFFEKRIIRWSIKLGCKFKPEKKQGYIGKLKHLVADKLVFRSVRGILGGKVSYVGCGGAPANERVLRFFWAANIPVYEGYGLTETSPLVSLNLPDKESFRIGSVGKLVPEVEVKISADKEILVKGPNVMKAYFKNEEQTKKTLVEGWLHTGDLGEFNDRKFLKIIGRKKEMFKTSYGKYIVPQAIEGHFVDSQLIEHLIVIGEGRHCAGAIISPSFHYCRKSLLANIRISRKAISKNPLVLKNIRKEVDSVNRKLGKTERIQKFLIVEDRWTQETGELSATQKLKRNIIIQKYAARIHKLYREDSR